MHVLCMVLVWWLLFGIHVYIRRPDLSVLDAGTARIPALRAGLAAGGLAW